MIFTDVIEFVEAMKSHSKKITQFESKGKLGFLAEDGEQFLIRIGDAKKSMENYAPNNEAIIVVDFALQGDIQKLTDYINENIIDENKCLLSMLEENSEPEKNNIQEIFVEEPEDKSLDDHVLDLLNSVVKLDNEELTDWINKSIYLKLFVDILNGEGPRGIWLGMILEKLNGETK